MKTINKVLLGMATVTTVLAPLVPKNININVNMESTVKKDYSTQLVKTQCDLAYKTITETGMQVCEYHCRANGRTTIFKTFRNNAAVCEQTIDERVAQSK